MLIIYFEGKLHLPKLHPPNVNYIVLTNYSNKEAAAPIN